MYFPTKWPLVSTKGWDFCELTDYRYMREALLSRIGYFDLSWSPGTLVGQPRNCSHESAVDPYRK